MGVFSRLFARENTPVSRKNALPPAVQKYIDTLDLLRAKYQIAGFKYFDLIYNDINAQIVAQPLLVNRIIQDAQSMNKPLTTFIHYTIAMLSVKRLSERHEYHSNSGVLNKEDSGIIDICFHAAATYSATMKNTVVIAKIKTSLNKIGVTIPQDYDSQDLSHENYLHLLDENWLLDRVDPSDPKHESYRRAEQEAEKVIKEANDESKRYNDFRKKKYPNRAIEGYFTYPNERKYFLRIQKYRNYKLFLRCAQNYKSLQNIEEIQTYYAELFHIYQPVYYGKEDNLFANIDEYNDALLHIGSLGLALDAFTEFSKFCIIYLAHYYIESELDKEFDGEKDRESIYIPGMLNQLTRALAFRDADQQHALLNAFDVLFPG